MTTLYTVMSAYASDFDKSPYHFKVVSIYDRIRDPEFVSNIFPLSCSVNGITKEATFKFFGDFIASNANRHLLHESLITTDNAIATIMAANRAIVNAMHDPELYQKYVSGTVESKSTSSDLGHSKNISSNTTLPHSKTENKENIDYADDMSDSVTDSNTTSESYSVQTNFDVNNIETLSQQYQSFLKQLDKKVFSQFL